MITASYRRSLTISAVRAAIADARRNGLTIACVPTMGALHEGHLSLIREAKKRADFVVATIFVNPLQFGPTEDLDRYPRTLESDSVLLQEAGVNLLFSPSVAEMYPDAAKPPLSATTPNHSELRSAINPVEVSSPGYDSEFEGAIRPTHFTGVLTVVAKIFNIIQPDIAVFGQKDLQQLSMIRRMVNALNFPIEIVGAPTVREDDGLALSSRNRFLSEADRKNVVKIYEALSAIRSSFEKGEIDAVRLKAVGLDVLRPLKSVLTLDYLELVDPDTFIPVSTAVTGTGVIVALRVGNTRLIDNIIL